MLTGLLHIHSAFRWIVVILAVIVLVRMLMLYVESAETFSPGNSTLVKVFLIFFDIQITIGILYLIAWAVKKIPVESYHYEHAATMIIAAGVAHFSARYKSSPAKERALKTFLLILLALIIVGVGVWRLPQGWRFLPSGIPGVPL